MCPQQFNYNSEERRAVWVEMLWAGLLVVAAARGIVVGWGTMLQAWRPRVRVPIKCIFFPSLPNASNRIMALMSTQPLAEMSTRNLPRGKGPPARKADVTVICEPIV
jgi:hypothetical protein